jgi:PQQ-like domain
MENINMFVEYLSRKRGSLKAWVGKLLWWKVVLLITTISCVPTIAMAVCSFNAGTGYQQGAYDCVAPTVYNYSGQSKFAGPDEPVKKWSIELVPEGSVGIQNTPVIGSNGTIYVVHYGSVHAINPDGSQKWIFTAEQSPSYTSSWMSLHYLSPVIAKDGTIYALSGYFLYAINPDGTLKWKFEHSGVCGGSQPTISTDGTIYLSGNFLTAVTASGSKKWEIALGNCKSVIDSAGTIYVSGSNAIFAVNSNGTIKWQSADVDTSGGGLLLLGNNGDIYSNSMKKLTALDKTNGSIKWVYEPTDAEIGYGSPQISSPVISREGTIYIVSADYTRSPGNDKDSARVHALNPDGTVKWIYNQVIDSGFMPGPMDSRPILDVNGVIYTGFGSEKDGIFAINPNGTLKWHFKDATQSFFYVSPGASMNIGSDSTLYFAQGTKLYALGSTIPLSDCSDKHAVYSVTNNIGKLVIPFVEIPLLNLYTHQPTGELAVFSGELKQVGSSMDFGLVSSKLKLIFLTTVADPCHAVYDETQKTLHTPFVDVNNEVYDVKFQHLKDIPLELGVFHLERVSLVE